MAGSTMLASKPMTVKAIASNAADYEFNPSIPLKYWIRTADTLLREVRPPPSLDRPSPSTPPSARNANPMPSLPPGAHLPERGQ